MPYPATWWATEGHTGTTPKLPTEAPIRVHFGARSGTTSEMDNHEPYETHATPVTPLEHELVDCNESGRASESFVAELMAADFLVPELMSDDGALQHLLVNAESELYLSVFTSLSLTGGARVDENAGDRLVVAPFHEVSRRAAEMGAGLAINPDLADAGFGSTLSGWLPAPFIRDIAMRASAFEFLDVAPEIDDELLQRIARTCQTQHSHVHAAYAASYVASGRPPAPVLAFELHPDADSSIELQALWDSIELHARELAADLVDVELMVLDDASSWQQRCFWRRVA